MARRKGLIWGILIVVALVAAGLVWQNQKKAARAEMEAGLASARILESVFERKAVLEVATLTGRALATSRYGDWIKVVQLTRAPFSVVYTVDLRDISASNYRWNAKDRIMTVEVPRVVIGTPNVDMARANVEQNGVWISRKAGQALQQSGVVRLNMVAAREGAKPENVARAQAAARDAVASLVAAPLAAAGQSDVRVVVLLPGEDRPAAMPSEQWDRSRSIPEVLRDLAGG